MAISKIRTHPASFGVIGRSVRRKLRAGCDNAIVSQATRDLDLNC